MTFTQRNIKHVDNKDTTQQACNLEGWNFYCRRCHGAQLQWKEKTGWKGKEEGPGSHSQRFATMADWKTWRRAPRGQRGTERERVCSGGKQRLYSSVNQRCWEVWPAVRVTEQPWQLHPTQCPLRNAFCAPHRRQRSVASSECDIIAFLYNRGYCRIGRKYGTLYL